MSDATMTQQQLEATLTDMSWTIRETVFDGKVRVAAKSLAALIAHVRASQPSTSAPVRTTFPLDVEYLCELARSIADNWTLSHENACHVIEHARRQPKETPQDVHSFAEDLSGIPISHREVRALVIAARYAPVLPCCASRRES